VARLIARELASNFRLRTDIARRSHVTESTFRIDELAFGAANEDAFALMEYLLPTPYLAGSLGLLRTCRGTQRRSRRREFVRDYGRATASNSVARAAGPANPVNASAPSFVASRTCTTDSTALVAVVA
jgi:hypothetical protein